MPVKKDKDKKSLTDKELKIISQTAEELANLAGFKKAKIDVFSEDQQTLQIKISQTGLTDLPVSWREAVFSFQLVLALIIYKKLGRWLSLAVDIEGWRQKREEELKKLALNSAQKVKFSGKEVILSQLNPAERRIIHLILADSQEVETESQGEGDQRVLIIRPKRNS